MSVTKELADVFSRLRLAYLFSTLRNTLLVMIDDTFRRQRTTQIVRGRKTGWLVGTYGVSSDVIIGTHSVLRQHL
jgi:hypothetical protein